MSILVFYIGTFTYFPIIYSIIGSFANWRPIRNIFEFSGFDNYKWMFENDLFWKSMWNTIRFAMITCALYVGLGLFFATLIFINKKFQGFFRSAFFMPVITSGVAVSILWRHAFYNTNSGIFNTVLEFFGGSPQMWLLDERLVIPCIIAMTVWKDLGYAIIIFFAGLKEVPGELFEAATIDGAGKMQLFRHIILPMVKPATLLVAVTGMINYLQVLNPILLMTSRIDTGTVGGPGTASFTSMVLVFQNAFREYHFGRASAVGYSLTVVILFFTFIQFRISKKGGDE